MTPNQNALLIAFSKLLRAGADALDEAAGLPKSSQAADQTNSGDGPGGSGPGEGDGGHP